jgi:Fur family transcriptional regulator, ferric uptake regulator
MPKLPSVTPSFLPRSAQSETRSRGARFKEADFKKLIRSMGLKVTAQRLLILQCLHDGEKTAIDRHVTAQELFDKVYAKDKGIGFATVYRFLRALADAQLVTEVRLGGQASRYELTSKHHHDHLSCTVCGLICEFENDKIELLQIQVAGQLGFTLTHHVLELYGLCPQCQKLQRSP